MACKPSKNKDIHQHSIICVRQSIQFFGKNNEKPKKQSDKHKSRHDASDVFICMVKKN